MMSTMLQKGTINESEAKRGKQKSQTQTPNFLSFIGICGALVAYERI